MASNYLVCATPRSGSTLLCEGLKASGVAGRPEEYFEAVAATGRPPLPEHYLAGVDDPDLLALLGAGAPLEPPPYSSLAGIGSYAEHSRAAAAVESRLRPGVDEPQGRPAALRRPRPEVAPVRCRQRRSLACIRVRRAGGGRRVAARRDRAGQYWRLLGLNPPGGEFPASAPTGAMGDKTTPGTAHGHDNREPIHVYVPGSVDDPRDTPSIPGVVIHRGPSLHPDDVTTHFGIPVTSPSRTLIDLAEVVTAAELRAAFARAREIGLLDPEALRAARARVEWRPSLAIVDEIIDEFCG